MSKKITVIAVAAVVVAVAASFFLHKPASQTQKQASLGKPRVLRVAAEGAYPPFSTVDSNGNLEGFDIDMANALCAQMNKAALAKGGKGVSCVLVKMDFDGMIQALQAKSVDLIVASMTITADRKRKVNFTNHYYSTPISYLVRAKDKASFDVSVAAMNKKVIGVQRGTTFQCFVQALYPQATLKPYATEADALLDLKAGRIDVNVSDGLQLRGMLLSQKAESADQLAIAGPDVYGVPPGSGTVSADVAQKVKSCIGSGIGIAVRKGDDGLRTALNAALAALRVQKDPQSGETLYDTISHKYFPKDKYPFDIYGSGS